MKPFFVGAIVAALILATLFVALLPSDPPPSEASEASPPAAYAIERAPKGDRQPAFSDRWVMLAQTPTIDRTEASAVPVPSGPAFAPTHQRAPAAHEICAAHGMHRQYYRRKGWTYWRCVR